ncbi:ComEC/Rec2 family competence protein [Plantibacter sp. Mn2098]|uniref:ComEC/Rec2 family competence protein n=1 Tax=Plantibacter sp. Mn2098 TaxID=3395266 RepID=UPI003BBA51FC
MPRDSSPVPDASNDDADPLHHADVEVHVLNVGQGSCTVILGPHGRVSVVDGGDERAWPGRIDATTWLRRAGVTHVDALVLTHLHRDHAQGLLAVAREFPVGVAHLPYGRFARPEPGADWLVGFERNADVDSPHGQFQLVTEYLDLLTILGDGGTDIRTWDASPAEELWSDSGWRLDRVHPSANEQTPTASLVGRLAQAGDGGLAEILDELSEGTNDDSAVFVLRADDAAIPPVVISGDQCGSEERWQRIVDRADAAGCVWILPHHGAPDGPSAAVAARLEPGMLIASAASGAAADVTGYWAELAAATGRPVIATHEYPDGERHLSRFGRLTVVVGG